MHRMIDAKRAMKAHMARNMYYIIRPFTVLLIVSSLSYPTSAARVTVGHTDSHTVVTSRSPPLRLETGVVASGDDCKIRSPVSRSASGLWYIV